MANWQTEGFLWGARRSFSRGPCRREGRFSSEDGFAVDFGSAVVQGMMRSVGKFTAPGWRNIFQVAVLLVRHAIQRHDSITISAQRRRCSARLSSNDIAILTILESGPAVACAASDKRRSSRPQYRESKVSTTFAPNRQPEQGQASHDPPGCTISACCGGLCSSLRETSGVPHRVLVARTLIALWWAACLMPPYPRG